MAAATAVTVAALAIAAGSAYYQAQQAKEGREAARDEANRQREEQENLLAEQDKRAKAEKEAAAGAEAKAAASRARRDQRKNTANPTVLTSPLGQAGPLQSASKDLLGA